MRFKNTWRYMGLGIATVGITVWLYLMTDQKTQDIPAWVQAVGSILAVGAAIWISESNRAEEQQSRNQSVLAVARVSHDFANKIYIELQSIQTEKACGFDSSNIRSIYHRDISQRYGEALANVPLHTLGSPEAVQALLLLQAQFSVFFPDAMDKLLQGPGEIARQDGSDTKARIYQEFIQQRIPAMKPQFKNISDQWGIIQRALA